MKISGKLMLIQLYIKTRIFRSIVIRQEYRQTLGLGLEQRTDIDISIIISLQQRKGM